MSSPLPESAAPITQIIGGIPYRMALAGGWIDQPFASRLNPSPPGAMLVVSLEPAFHFMDRAGMATSTRKAARQAWGERLPERPHPDLVRELYRLENDDRPNPSGSQDMAGIIYPGISRLDYDYDIEGGVFPARVESCNDPLVIAWLERVLHILPVCPRPQGYDPLIIRNLLPEWIARLGQCGHAAFAAVLRCDAPALGAAMTGTMLCWKVLLPGNFEHPRLTMPLLPLLSYYQERYYGAAYSSCGGGYLYVVSDEEVPGAFHPIIRAEQSLHA
ncbi:MAG: hypothetical protein WCE68_14755 [Anaerolineales bacterium]